MVKRLQTQKKLQKFVLKTFSASENDTFWRMCICPQSRLSSSAIGAGVGVGTACRQHHASQRPLSKRHWYSQSTITPLHSAHHLGPSGSALKLYYGRMVYCMCPIMIERSASALLRWELAPRSAAWPSPLLGGHSAQASDLDDVIRQNPPTTWQTGSPSLAHRLSPSLETKRLRHSAFFIAEFLHSSSPKFAEVTVF